ncbi:uncharacterized protein LOC113847478 [Abrus precatorius]|uniref:Uncharacterized protein LOC113847478 n=1 Tax=Abrus precatorius TaxID=3816 RepID=A0A8B8JLS8_ABRPR|nr:uncharacterized protein LOC113847478 [Abrus precatorius]
MASACVSMVSPLSSPTQNRLNLQPFKAFLRPLPFPQPKRTAVKRSLPKPKLGIEASMKEKAVKGLTTAVIASYMLMPEVVHAAGNDFSPSLKNFLLSIVAGGVVLAAIFAAVIGVANFDPVKRA